MGIDSQCPSELTVTFGLYSWEFNAYKMVSEIIEWWNYKHKN